jgi:hypothetical protein
MKAGATCSGRGRRFVVDEVGSVFRLATPAFGATRQVF